MENDDGRREGDGWEGGYVEEGSDYTLSGCECGKFKQVKRRPKTVGWVRRGVGRRNVVVVRKSRKR